MSDLAREMACWWLIFSTVIGSMLICATKSVLTLLTITYFISVGFENVKINPAKMSGNLSAVNGSCYHSDNAVPAQVTIMLLMQS